MGRLGGGGGRFSRGKGEKRGGGVGRRAWGWRGRGSEWVGRQLREGGLNAAMALTSDCAPPDVVGHQ